MCRQPPDLTDEQIGAVRQIQTILHEAAVLMTSAADLVPIACGLSPGPFLEVPPYGDGRPGPDAAEIARFAAVEREALSTCAAAAFLGLDPQDRCRLKFVEGSPSCPRIVGSQVLATDVIGLVADGCTPSEVCERRPGLVVQDVLACLDWGVRMEGKRAESG